MRIIRLRLSRFRGFSDLDLYPPPNVLLVGEPRAGRSTILDAIRRVLDAGSTRVRPSRWDITLPSVDIEDGDTYPLTSVEATLIDLDDEIEQLLDDRLEMLDPTTGEPDDADTDAVLGVRLRYCLQYTPADDTLEHWVEYTRTGSRVPRAHRDALHAIVIDRAAPLQLRVEGAFRNVAASQDEERLLATLDAFEDGVREATEDLAASDAVSEALKAMTKQGAALALGVSKQQFVEGVGFAADDGSISGLLRAIQPTLSLDDAGALPLSSHGSTTPSILAITEAITARRFEHRIVIVDDFGDSMDSSSTDFVARMLRRPGNQVWLSTRRAEAIDAFSSEEIVRLTRAAGTNLIYRLEPRPDRSERRRRRHLAQILAPAMSARTVAFVEGPHDLEGYAALDRKALIEERKAPLSARGIQLIPASMTGADGGNSRLIDLATLARSLGYRVRVVLDSDKPGQDDDLIAELGELCEVVIVLPTRTAVERSLAHGVAPSALRTILGELNREHGLGLTVDDITDDDLEKVTVKQLKQKGGLHKAFVDLLPEGEFPAIAAAVLDALKSDPVEDSIVQIVEP